MHWLLPSSKLLQDPIWICFSILRTRNLDSRTIVLIPNFSDTSSFGTFSVADTKTIGLLEKDTYTLAGPGPIPDRQDVPHLHDAVLDPTKTFIVVPDLGSDLLRIFKITAGTTSVTALTPVKAVPASGPRHAGFAVLGQNTFLYTVNELSNTITGYSVSYTGDSGITLTRLFDFNSHGPGATVPDGTKAAEIVVSVSEHQCPPELPL